MALRCLKLLHSYTFVIKNIKTIVFRNMNSNANSVFIDMLTYAIMHDDSAVASMVVPLPDEKHLDGVVGVPPAVAAEQRAELLVVERLVQSDGRHPEGVLAEVVEAPLA